MKILVLTSVFPNHKQPGLGVFVRERMFKVAEQCELKVVAPVAWFPLIHLLRKNYRPPVAFHEIQNDIEVFHPKFFNIPRYFKFLDGFFFFLCSLYTLRTIRKTFDFDVIDAHFTYPDGFGAVLLGKYFRRPVTITVRGTIRKFSRTASIRPLVKYALQNAAQVFAVCEDLRQAAIEAGGYPDNIEVIANGVDNAKFFRVDQASARQALQLDLTRKIIISVGGLTERKGFHRIIEQLPALRDKFPDILLIIVGGSSVEGDNEVYLRKRVTELNLTDHVLFAGAQPHDQLYRWLNAADIFCLATSNEGWANVFLEAMACGLPVVTTAVGGNPEVICSDDLGILVPFGDSEALKTAIESALLRNWDRNKIVDYASENTWDRRVALLLDRFRTLTH